jgi:hypothetical protein
MGGNHSMHVTNDEKHLVRNAEEKTAQKDNTRPTEKNAGISGICSSGMKADIMMVFADVIHQLKQFYLYTNGKVVRSEPLSNERHL